MGKSVQAMFEPNDDELYFAALGGTEEFGINLNLYAYGGQWLMVDLGMGFADENLSRLICCDCYS